MDHTILLREVAAGDRRAFEALYDAFKDRVYNTALGYVQDPSDAEEITQDVFVEIYHSAERFAGGSTVGTWIYRIAVNKSLDRLRHAKRKKRFAVVQRLFGDAGEPMIDPPHFDHPGVALEKKELAALLFGAVRQLPDQQQTAFVLAIVEALPQQEVAEIMQLSVKAVESLLQRAKAALRNALADIHEPRRKSSRATSKHQKLNINESEQTAG